MDGRAVIFWIVSWKMAHLVLFLVSEGVTWFYLGSEKASYETKYFY